MSPLKLASELGCGRTLIINVRLGLDKSQRSLDILGNDRSGRLTTGVRDQQMGVPFALVDRLAAPKLPA